jgi:hypothetical protein
MPTASSSLMRRDDSRLVHLPPRSEGVETGDGVGRFCWIISCHWHKGDCQLLIKDVMLRRPFATPLARSRASLSRWQAKLRSSLRILEHKYRRFLPPPEMRKLCNFVGGYLELIGRSPVVPAHPVAVFLALHIRTEDDTRARMGISVEVEPEPRPKLLLLVISN